MADSAGHKLSYNLYVDPGRTTVWGNWFDKNVKGATIDVPLGKSERVTGSVNVYGRIATNQKDVPAGAYRVKLGGRQAMVGYAYASKGSCVSVKFEQTVTNLGLAVAAIVGSAGAAAGPGAITAPDATRPDPNAGAAPQTTAGQPEQKKSVFQKLKENAEYQQQQQNRAAGTSSAGQSTDSSQAKQEDRAK